jgi:hypothetical protein
MLGTILIIFLISALLAHYRAGRTAELGATNRLGPGPVLVIVVIPVYLGRI